VIQVRLFGRCRIYHDPVAPVLNAPAEIGWEAWFRRVDLVTPRKLKGKELLIRTRVGGRLNLQRLRRSRRRMAGWWWENKVNSW